MPSAPRLVRCGRPRTGRRTTPSALPTRPAVEKTLARPPVPVGVQLMEELVAASGFVVLPDCSRSPPQAVERLQESPVRLVRPAHVPRAPPARLSEKVEPAVVADAVTGVRLDVVPGQIAEPGP